MATPEANTITVVAKNLRQSMSNLPEVLSKLEGAVSAGYK
jgi:hypothetical protein